MLHEQTGLCLDSLNDRGMNFGFLPRWGEVCTERNAQLCLAKRRGGVVSFGFSLIGDSLKCILANVSCLYLGAETLYGC